MIDRSSAAVEDEDMATLTSSLPELSAPKPMLSPVLSLLGTPNFLIEVVGKAPGPNATCTVAADPGTTKQIKARSFQHNNKNPEIQFSDM